MAARNLFTVYCSINRSNVPRFDWTSVGRCCEYVVHETTAVAGFRPERTLQVFGSREEVAYHSNAHRDVA